MNEHKIGFLADENCDFKVINALRNTGFDVMSVFEFNPGATDSNVMGISKEQNRILLTEDRDFGEWIYAHGKKSPGVIFIRFPANARSLLAQEIIHLVQKYSDKLSGSFIVLEPGKVRIRKI